MDSEVLAAVRAADGAAFAGLAERHRRELRVHCYRMVGSFDDAEDLVQEALLRAWRYRGSFQGRSAFRAWLYRIATNVCLDFLERHPRQPTPGESGRPAEVGWLQPFPDGLLEPVAAREAEPEAVVVATETIELACVVAIQHLPPRQRAVLILRDMLGWPAAETAALLGMSVAAVKSALQRARPVLREHLPERRAGRVAATPLAGRERELLRRFVRAHERADTAALAELLSEDVRLSMPPLPYCFTGRAKVVAFVQNALGSGSPLHRGQWRGVPAAANRQPAMAGYIRLPGEAAYQPQVLNVLRIEDGEITEIVAFEPRVFGAFGLPATLP
ncbi:RNA polymerase subunit sigma-70 [Streptomyces colonosanans]|uniref:RNA polymerase sigma factor n=1 Tax=Streptomyces colonosanans TaxID=1428652 RepID=A0A1S2PK19_9ACTN|nr:RNA polymerase subunit sigma-70 [Streptomyces colonosanans]